MTIKPDQWIRRMAVEMRMIEPFEPGLVRGDVLSFGVSSYGYDVRLAGEFRVPIAPHGTNAVLDPKSPSDLAFMALSTLTYDLAPHSFVLGRTVEYFRIPRDVLTLCLGKSSYARCGVLVNVTPFEPGWEGHATLCIANVGHLAVRLHAAEGIAQVIFLQSDEPCEATYADRRGKYQAQQGVTLPRLG